MLSNLARVRTEGRRVLVVGLGISGIAAARYLARQGISVVAIDRNSEAEIFRRKGAERDLDALKSLGVEIHLETDGEAIGPYLKSVALAVLSPGVSLESAIVGTVRRHGISYIGELEFALGMTSAPSIVVTGSNGKSTTVGLIHSILQSAGKSSFICGNYGIPLSALLGDSGPQLEQINNSVLVVEASSYQLESCTTLKPKIGVWLNISDNHLERHGTLDRYIDAKRNLFAKQDDGDFAILNQDDPAHGRFAQIAKSTILGYGLKVKGRGASIEYDPSRARDTISVNLNDEIETYDLVANPLLGLHNRYNIAAAILSCRVMGVPVDRIVQGINSFRGLPHRIEKVGTLKGGDVINDSKSTTVAATKAALECVLAEYTGKIILMVGGLSKAGSWRPLLDLVSRNRARFAPIVCFGKDGHIIASHVESLELPFVNASGLRDAVAMGADMLGPGTVLLFSPGCASFDEFLNFEQRGERFCDLIRETRQSSPGLVR